MYNLTNKQKAVLQFLKKYYIENDVSPTMQEVAENFGLSIPTIQGYFKELELKGAIKRTPHKNRSISITSIESNNTKLLPISGDISAGNGISVHEENSEFIKVPKSWLQEDSHQYYGLRVKGFSMYQDGILDGDIVIIRKQNYANSGDTVVGITHDDNGEIATLKKFKDLSPELIELQPRNPLLNPIRVSREKFEIRGKFIGLIRRDKTGS